MKCSEAKLRLSSHLDAMLTGAERREMSAHLNGCAECRTELAQLSTTQRLVSGLGRKQAPADLALKLRVMLSQAAASKRRSAWDGLLVRWQNALNAFMVPATAGMLSAVIMFGLLLGMMVPVPLVASNDVPTSLYTPPELTSSPFGFEVMNSVNSDSLMIEAYIDSNGRVQDYRILSSPESAKDIMPELKKMLIFTQFRPATSFGQPTSGRAILTFNQVNVKG
jgi:predicted anti-sigma-YlaC factor YlaD